MYPQDIPGVAIAIITQSLRKPGQVTHKARVLEDASKLASELATKVWSILPISEKRAMTMGVQAQPQITPKGSSLGDRLQKAVSAKAGISKKQ